MNIFVSYSCPVNSARALDDKRVIKQCAESVQLLVTALYANGVPLSELPCRPTHQNHPCNIWARSSRSNYLWLIEHTAALMAEKLARYPNRPAHVYQQHLAKLKQYATNIGDIGLTRFANCAANDSLGVSFKHITDVHQAYQSYLNYRWQNTDKNATWYGVGGGVNKFINKNNL